MLPSPAYVDDRVTVHHGDCLEVLAALPACSVDAIVTDPPYGLGFMGKGWDALPPGLDWARECLRVLKPGGHLLAFGGTRTWHRLAVAVEDAGFEVRDSIAWLYGSGFPKSLDVSKALDKRRDEKHDAERRAVILTVTGWIAAARDAAGLNNRAIDAAFGTNGMAGHWTSAKSQPSVPTADQWPRLLDLFGAGEPPAEVRDAVDEWLRIKGQPCPTWDEREVLSERVIEVKGGNGGWSDMVAAGRFKPGEKVIRETLPATPAAQQWQGWGTALKPAFEPIVVARKPLVGTVAANVLAHGTGALNIDGCRVGTSGGSMIPSGMDRLNAANAAQGYRPGTYEQGPPQVPAPAGRWPSNVLLDGDQADALDAQSGTLRSGANPTRRGADHNREVLGAFAGQAECEAPRGAETGGASRFFPTFRYQAKAPTRERPNVDGIAHPTVKPLDLMRWLVRLVTPPGGVVLEPFAGSGTTVEACLAEGVRCVAIEREADYLPLIAARIARQAPADVVDEDSGDGTLFELPAA